MIFWKMSLQQLRFRLARTTLTLASIVIGVTALVGVAMAVHTARTAFGEMYEALAGKADIIVEPHGGGSFPESYVQTIAAASGVKSVAPLLRRNGLMYTDTGKVRLLLLGIDPRRDVDVREYKVVDGRYFSGNDEIMLEHALAQGLKIKLGDEVRFLTRQGLMRKQVVGFLAASGAAEFAEGSVAFWSLPDLQQAFRGEGQISTAFVVSEPGRDPAALRQALDDALPDAVDVTLATSHTGTAQGVLFAVQLAMAFSLVITVLAMGFIVLNTFLMNVTERRRSLAILRVVGASNKQLKGMLVREGILLAVAGTLIGLPLGYGVSHLIIAGMEKGFQVALPSPNISPLWLLAAIAINLAVVIGATLYPAKKAAEVSRAGGLGRDLSPRDDDAPQSKKPLIVAGVMVVVATTLYTLMLKGLLPLQVGIGGAVLPLLATVLVSQRALPWAITRVGAVMRRFSPVFGLIAEKQLLRHRLRTQLTWAILFFAVAGSFALGNVLMDVVSDVSGWFRETIRSDFVLRVTMPGVDSGDAAGMGLELKEGIQAIPAVSQAVGVRFFLVDAQGSKVVAIARQFEVEDHLPLSIQGSIPGEDPFKQVLAGDLVMGTIAAQQLGVSPGDVITVAYGGKSHELRVAATCSVYAMGGMAVVLDYRAAQRVFGIEGADAFLIQADRKANPGVEAALQKIADDQGAILQSYLEFASTVDGLIGGVVASLWVILTFGFMLALLGIVNTLTMNILEQVQELGMLRVVGMTKAHVRRLILGQAIMHGVLALIPGLIVGYLLGQLVRSTSLWMVGEAARLTPRPLIFATYFVVVLGLVSFIAWFPARRAANTSILAALKRE